MKHEQLSEGELSKTMIRRQEFLSKALVRREIKEKLLLIRDMARDRKKMEKKKKGECRF